MQWSTSPHTPVFVKSGWKHNGHWIRQRATETHFKYCEHQYVFYVLRPALRVPGTGLCTEYPQWQVAAVPCMVGWAH